MVARPQDVVEKFDPEHGDHDGITEDQLRDHEEVTKVKNVNFIELGRHRIEAWYFSPFPRDYYASGVCDTVRAPAYVGAW